MNQHSCEQGYFNCVGEGNNHFAIDSLVSKFLAGCNFDKLTSSPLCIVTEYIPGTMTPYSLTIDGQEIAVVPLLIESLEPHADEVPRYHYWFRVLKTDDEVKNTINQMSNTTNGSLDSVRLNQYYNHDCMQPQCSDVSPRVTNFRKRLSATSEAWAGAAQVRTGRNGVGEGRGSQLGAALDKITDPELRKKLTSLLVIYSRNGVSPESNAELITALEEAGDNIFGNSGGQLPLAVLYMLASLRQGQQATQ